MNKVDMFCPLDYGRIRQIESKLYRCLSCGARLEVEHLVPFRDPCENKAHKEYRRICDFVKKELL